MYMITLSYEKACQNLAVILSRSVREAGVGIKAKDGSVFVVNLGKKLKSSLDFKGVKLGITKGEIIEWFNEYRGVNNHHSFWKRVKR